MPNKLSQFWQELKRRKVVRVITVYAASAFVILEAIDIIFPRMGFPDWTVTFVIFLIVIGFIVAVILSWIFDINPEGGLERTMPAQKIEEDEKSTTSSSWKIASYVSFGVIIVLIIFNIIPRSSMFNDRSGPERSIAVLPFRNDSPDQENMGFIYGTMEQILDNLTKIKDLRVISRTSMAQYMDNPKPIKVIADEMDVGYILEGSGQRDGERVRITVQLLDAKKDMHLWSRTYQQEDEEMFDLQSEVARLVVNDLEVLIGPESELNSDELTAERKTAQDFYERGLKEMNLYWENDRNKKFLENAEYLFRSAPDYDSTFVEPYQQLAQIYYEKWFRLFGGQEVAQEMRLNKALEVVQDSILVISDKALLMGSRDPEIHILKGFAYRQSGKMEKAREAYKDALSIDPDNVRARDEHNKTYLYTDAIKILELSFEVLEQGLPSHNTLRELYFTLMHMGFKELSRHYLDELYKLRGLTGEYDGGIARIETTFGDYHAARAFALKPEAEGYWRRIKFSITALTYLLEHQYDSALVFYRQLESIGEDDLRRMGFVLVQTGEIEEGERYIDENFADLQEKLVEEQVPSETYLDLSEIHAYRGEKEKAIDYLRTFSLLNRVSLSDLVKLRSPLFDNIRDEPEFKEIEAEFEAKYQAEHERVKKWLEENEML